MAAKNPITKKIIEETKVLFDLEGWDIVVRVSEEDSDNLGEVAVLPEYRSADITLFVAEIRKHSRVSVYDVFIHEVGEIVSAECLFALPEKVRKTDEYYKVADVYAEKLLRIHRNHKKGLSE